jgi:hypothetical protein
MGTTLTWVKATAEGALCAATESAEKSGASGTREAASVEPPTATAPTATAVRVFIWGAPYSSSIVARHPISRADSNSGSTLGGWVVRARPTRLMLTTGITRGIL